jgi:hypothetical protein
MTMDGGVCVVSTDLFSMSYTACAVICEGATITPPPTPVPTPPDSGIPHGAVLTIAILGGLIAVAAIGSHFMKPGSEAAHGGPVSYRTTVQDNFNNGGGKKEPLLTADSFAAADSADGWRELGAGLVQHGRPPLPGKQLGNGGGGNGNGTARGGANASANTSATAAAVPAPGPAAVSVGAQASVGAQVSAPAVAVAGPAAAPAREWTAEHVAREVCSIGKAYEKFRDPILDNGLDSRTLLASADSDLKELLGITNDIHLRKLQQKVKEVMLDGHKAASVTFKASVA